MHNVSITDFHSQAVAHVVSVRFVVNFMSHFTSYFT